MTDQKRRRIDRVLSPEFAEDLGSLDLEELRSRRDLAEEVEREMSYYRRMLHGRMDLLAFELRRRSGEETRTLIEALPDIIASGMRGAGDVGGIRHLSLDLDLPQVTGRRAIDHVLEDDAVTRVAEMDDDELAAAQHALADAEGEISNRRRRLHGIIDRLQAEIIDRYKRGLAESDASG